MNPIGRGTVPFYTEAVAVTPGDATDIAPTLALYVGGAGHIRVDMLGTGTNVLLQNVPAGILRIAVTRVYSTGTTATNIVALRA